MRISVTLLLVLAAAIFGAPLITDHERAAGIAPDAINFELLGPPDAPLVVLIHGVSGPMMVWDRTVELLSTNGFRTLRFDLYGRGASGRPPDGQYGLPQYLAELDRVLTLAQVPPDAPLMLVGSSMGAMIASEFTSLHPERVAALALIGPAGFPLKASPLAKLLEVPTVGDWAMRVFGDASLAAHDRRYYFAPERFRAFQARFEEQLRIAGSKHAILMTLRNAPVQGYLEGYDRVGKTAVPKLVIWGREDQAFPYDNHLKLMPRLPGARLVTVEQAGHLPQVEQDQITGPALLAFLRDKK